MKLFQPTEETWTAEKLCIAQHSNHVKLLEKEVTENNLINWAVSTNCPAAIVMKKRRYLRDTFTRIFQDFHTFLSKNNALGTYRKDVDPSTHARYEIIQDLMSILRLNNVMPKIYLRQQEINKNPTVLDIKGYMPIEDIVSLLDGEPGVEEAIAMMRKAVFNRYPNSNFNLLSASTIMAAYRRDMLMSGLEYISKEEPESIDARRSKLTPRQKQKEFQRERIRSEAYPILQRLLRNQGLPEENLAEGKEAEIGTLKRRPGEAGKKKTHKKEGNDSINERPNSGFSAGRGGKKDTLSSYIKSQILKDREIAPKATDYPEMKKMFIKLPMGDCLAGNRASERYSEIKKMALTSKNSAKRAESAASITTVTTNSYSNESLLGGYPNEMTDQIANSERGNLPAQNDLGENNGDPAKKSKKKKNDQMPLSGEFLSWRAKQKLEPSLLLEDGTSANRIAKRNGYHHRKKRSSVWEIKEMTAEKCRKSKGGHRSSAIDKNKIILSSVKA